MIYLPPGVTAGALYGTSEWKEERRGRVTASRFSDAVTPPKTIPADLREKYAHLLSEPRYRMIAKGKNAGAMKEVEGYGEMIREAMEAQGEYAYGDTAKSYLFELIAAAITGQDRVGGKGAAVDRGLDLESDALDQYQRAKMVDLGKGRTLHLEDCSVSATPDAFVEEDDDGPGLVEVKCPEAKRHIQTFLEKRLPDEYVEQVQGQMAVAGRGWCDFVSYDDRFPIPMRLVIIRVVRDQPFIDSMMAKVRHFAGIRDERVRQLRAYLRDCAPSEAAIVHQAVIAQFLLQESAEPFTSPTGAE